MDTKEIKWFERAGDAEGHKGKYAGYSLLNGEDGNPFYFIIFEKKVFTPGVWINVILQLHAPYLTRSFVSNGHAMFTGANRARSHSIIANNYLKRAYGNTQLEILRDKKFNDLIDFDYNLRLSKSGTKESRHKILTYVISYEKRFSAPLITYRWFHVCAHLGIVPSLEELETISTIEKLRHL